MAFDIERGFREIGFKRVFKNTCTAGEAAAAVKTASGFAHSHEWALNIIRSVLIRGQAIFAMIRPSR